MNKRSILGMIGILPGAVMAMAVAGPASGDTLELGEPLTITNAGFEADFVDPGCFAVFQPTGWEVFDPNGIEGGDDVVGGLDPTDSTFFPGGAPEGDRVGIVFLAGEVGAGPMGLTQVLVGALQANTTYTLMVEVGDIASGTGPPPCDVFGFFNLEGFPGYQVQLLAGGDVLAEDDNTLAATLEDGEFALSTVTIAIGDSHPQLGEPLEVRLINLNTPGTEEEPGIEVDFDDVRLFAKPINGAAIPVASEWGVMAAAMVITIAATVTLHTRRRPARS